MEEEVGIKVTRLRRRLSVEADDVKSPSTPTKKRGGRLAAKPQLELIDENTIEAAPKRTRKSTVKDVAEPVEEKAITPSRRSTRIRSNTSIASETPAEAEDKGTPSRRSTRIKSNTSIVAETVQNVNSPRAKRAARRTSLAGSDNEAPVTPSRQTRRTRKDSTSSIDKQVELNAGKLGGQVSDVIVEESENNIKETKTTDPTNNDSPSLRKSPRLVEKSDNRTSLDNNNKDRSEGDKETNETNKEYVRTEPITDQTNKAIKEKITEQNNISVSSSNLIKEIDENPKKIKYNLNKSTTAVEEPKTKAKRNRTKSWTTISVEPFNGNSFCSDSEASKKKSKRTSISLESFCSDSEATNKKNKRERISLNASNISGSGDGVMNTSNKNEPGNKDQENIKEVTLNSSSMCEKKKKKRYEKSMLVDTEISVHELSVINISGKLNKSTVQISEEKETLISSKALDTSATDKLFEQAPTGLIQSLVYIEDSDSNSSTNKNKKVDKDCDSGDQCVPVIDHQLAKDEAAKETQNNLSYEPMDIDETMPENVSLTNYLGNNNTLRNDKESESEKQNSILNESHVKEGSINKSERKSMMSYQILGNNGNESLNTFKTQSSIIDAVDDNIEKNTNKSNRKSSISNLGPEDTVDGSEKSLIKDAPIDENMAKKSKRKSSLKKAVTDDNVNNISYKSIQNSSTDEAVSNKSKRKSSVSFADHDKSTTDNSYKSSRKSLETDLTNGENKDGLNKSNSQYLISAIGAEDRKDMRKSSTSDSRDDSRIINKSSNKSTRKSSDNLDKSNNKSKSKFSKSTIDSQALDKTENEDKSTLVLSQLRDVSDSEINIDSVLPEVKLSMSVDVPNKNTVTGSENNNLSLTYSTSTPLQQKAVKKLGMQINSSVIAPNSSSKTEKKSGLNTSKKEVSIMSEENDSDSSGDENSEEDESKFIDDEAEEVSDAYESGDSRNDEEKEYEEQNEIVEKGETLDSDDEAEYSDDSDYEKDSFIVSSDEEDNDLLSGSGDDLSLSANELSMSVKSKKKYNERKLKEQKKASREMFEARHKINESDQKKKSKKSNSQKLESSSESDEKATQPKKNKRQRIDSTQDISAVQSDTDKSIFKIKKKIRRLSESISEDNATNEQEITIREPTQSEIADPLTLQNAIKEEPKTPQKELNISTVAVTNIEEVEEVNIDENISIIKANQTTDPLQTTVAQGDSEDDNDTDSISENEEITNNYESILKDLNKANSKKNKSLDMSLNLNKKTKKVNEPIIDQLNLTQGKKSKKKKDASEINESKKIDRSLENKSSDKIDKQAVFSEGSSDSIDMKLLFPDDSNDSEAVGVKGKKHETNKSIQEEDAQNIDDFIPLKRTEGKTNILESTDNANKSNNDSILNVSNKKKNKRKSSQTEDAVTINDEESENVSFFFDTTGTHTEELKTDANTSIKNSAKKNKHKNNVSFAVETNADDNSNDAPLEISYRSEKNKSKQDLNMSQIKNNTQPNSSETPSHAKKKKNKKGLNSTQNITEVSIIENTENEAPADLVQNSSLGSAKKQKLVSESSTIEQENEIQDDKDVVQEEETSKKRKRKSSANQTIEEITVKDDIKLNTSSTLTESSSTKRLKKKRKISRNDEDGAQNQDTLTDPQKQEKDPVKNAKKKKHQQICETDEEATRKNKKRKERDDDDASKISKILKQDSLDKVHVPRLPENVLKQLDDKPKIDIIEAKKLKVISTSSFMVEQTKKRKNKPSNYLEESVYLNDDFEDRKPKGSIKNPKVLPFIPTASTSGFGFTTNFKVNIIPQEIEFIAQTGEQLNFKDEYLAKKRIKKLGTFEMYKRQRSIKLTKF